MTEKCVILKGVANCIHTYAGVQLRAECMRQMNLLRIAYGRDYEQPVAVPMLTDAFNLPAGKVIHIVGPVVQDRVTPALEKDLADCYLNTLRRAAEIAVNTVTEWTEKYKGRMNRVIFNVFKDQDRVIYEEITAALEAREG